MRTLISALFMTCAALAQLDSNSITVTASRRIYPALDEVQAYIRVYSPPDVTLEQVTEALRGAGAGPVTFGTVQTNRGFVIPIGAFEGSTMWTFIATSPLSGLKEWLGRLDSAKAAIARSGSRLSMSYDVSGPQSSAKARLAVACSQSDLIADARSQAQAMAAAAGVGLGPVLAVADSGSAATAVAFIGASGASGTFLFGIAPTVTPITCAATVKFGFSRY